MSQFWRNKKVLVVGGAGFIGSHTVDELLARGAKVAVFDDLSTGRRANCKAEASFYRGDIVSVSSVLRVFNKEKPDYVFNFAAVAHVPWSIEDPLRDAKSITGLINILNHAVRFKVRKIIHASSGFIYGNAKRYPTPESEPLQPLNPYSVSKAACEDYLKFFYLHHGLPFAVLRYSTVYGPRRIDGAIPYYLRCISSGKQAEIYGSKTRDMIFISDVVRANILAMEKECGSNPVFNIGSGREYYLSDIYSLIAKLLGRPGLKGRFLPERQGEVERFYLDAKKAKRVLGFSARIPLHDGLRKTIEWFVSAAREGERQGLASRIG